MCSKLSTIYDSLVQISHSLLRGEPYISNIALKCTFRGSIYYMGSILGSKFVVTALEANHWINSCVAVLYRYQDTGKSTSVHVRTLPVQLYALPAGPTATPFVLLVWSTILINKSTEFASYWLHPPLGVGNCKLSRPGSVPSTSSWLL